MDLPWYEAFFAESRLVEIGSQLKSGKKAAVYVCRSGLAVEATVVAAKSFHGRLVRGLQNRILYQDGRVITDSRTARAVATKTRSGREAKEAARVDREFDDCAACTPPVPTYRNLAVRGFRRS